MKRLRRDALTIFRAALGAADPADAIRRHVRLNGDTLIAGGRRYRLERFRRIQVIGAGKASGAMAQAIERLLGRRLQGGLVSTKYGHTVPLRRVEICECGHPVPDARGVEGASRVAEIAREAGPDELLIVLISGGASALLPAPAPPITLDEKQQTTRLLLASGANIHELNTVRKHISSIKGGQLARLAQPATVLALMLSDVIGDDLDVIGSGPTVPDRSTFVDAAGVLEKFGLMEKVPASVRDRIEQGCGGEIPDTPKSGDAVFERVRNLVVGSNRLAVAAAAHKARELGYRPLVLSTYIEGETADVARMHAAIAREVVASGRPIRPPTCIISGGETTVTLQPDSGTGGRNQEFVLAAALDIAGLDGVVVFSGGTDGTDGPTDAAGAIGDGQTISRAHSQSLDARRFLAGHDSYHFFERLGDLLKTGPTGTNVMDVRLVLIR